MLLTNVLRHAPCVGVSNRHTGSYFDAELLVRRVGCLLQASPSPQCSQDAGACGSG